MSRTKDSTSEPIIRLRPRLAAPPPPAPQEAMGIRSTPNARFSPGRLHADQLAKASKLESYAQECLSKANELRAKAAKLDRAGDFDAAGKIAGQIASLTYEAQHHASEASRIRTAVRVAEERAQPQVAAS